MLNQYLKKSVSQLIKLATKHFNKYIRLRDAEGDYFICISCNTPKDLKQMNAGHYYPTTKSFTRFNENNVHGQCVRCNHFLSGNLTPYRESLIRKIGKEEVEKLDALKSLSKRWDKLELIAIIKEYRKKVSDLQKK